MTLLRRATQTYRQKGILRLIFATLRYSRSWLLRPFLSKRTSSAGVADGAPERVMSRNDRVRRFCNIHQGVGLEIGPLSIPVVGKQEGTIYYVDCFSTEELRERYKNDKYVELDKIAKVDFNTRIVSYKDIHSTLGSVDYVIASHVLEHFPNPLGWLRSIAGLLKPGGIVSLVVPDRRYTFDYYRKETTLAQLVSYDLDQLEGPSTEQILDCFMNICTVDVKDAWNTHASGFKPKLQQEFRSMNEVVGVLNRERRDIYTHCTVWTFESFCEIMPQALKLSNIPLEMCSACEPERLTNEFIVHLKRSSDTQPG